MRTSRLVRQLIVASAALASPFVRAAAQLPSASAAASGLGESFTAVARGAQAAAWSPANLGLPGNPRFSLVIGGRTDGGLDPVGLGDLAEWGGQVVPDAVKSEWLARIRDAGRLRMAGTGGVTPIAIGFGRLALALGAEAAAHGDVAPDAAELLLYGNAGATGAARDLSFAGTDFGASAVTTAAASWGQPLVRRAGHALALGITAKYLVGNAYIAGRDRGGAASASPLGVTLDLPIVQSDSAFDRANGRAGRGWGMDVGLAWQGGPLRASAVVKNAVNTFAWDASRFWWRPGTARYDQDTSVTDFTPRRLATAPAEVRERVTGARYARELAVGGAWRPNGRLLVSADVRRRLGERNVRARPMNAGPTEFEGVGVELRPFGFLPLRAGAARVDGAARVAAGAGIALPGFALDAAAARQPRADGASSGVATLTVTIGGR